MSQYVTPMDNPKVRKVGYTIQWIVSLVMGVLGIVLSAQYGVEHLPGWYTTAGLVLAFVWTYTGLVAQANVPTVSKPGEHMRLRNEGGYLTQLPLGLLIAIFVIVLLNLLILLHVITPGR